MTRQNKPEFEKIKNLRLRFGFRLNSIFWPLDITARTQILDKLGYKDIQTEANGSINASKNRIDFYSDYPKMVFGFYADTIDSLITAYREFFASAQKDFRVNLNNFIRFYEIENVITYYLEHIPRNNFANIFSDSNDMKEFTSIVGESISAGKLEIVSADTKIQDDEWFTIEIAPKVESAANAYHCRIIKRSKNSEDVIKTLRKSNEVLEKLASSIEKKNP